MLTRVVRNTFIRQAAALSGPELLQLPAKLIATLVVADVLGPALLGSVNAVSLVFSYSMLMQLGAFDGVLLKAPFLIGRGMREQADHYVGTCYRFMLAGLAMYAGAALGLTIAWTNDPVLVFGVASSLVAALLYQMTNYRQTLLRFAYRFRPFAYSQVALVFSSFAATLAFTVMFGVYGTLIAVFLAYLPPLLYLAWGVRVQVPSGFSWESLRDLIACGWPMIVIGMLDTVFITVDRWFIIAYLGIDKLGYYAIVFSLSSLILIVPVKIVSLMIQYLREIYGQWGDKVVIWEYCQRFIVTTGVMFVPVALILDELVFLVFRSYLIQYQPSVALVRIFMLWIWLTTQFHLLNAYFVVTDQKSWVISGQAVALLSAVIFSAGAVWLGLGLSGIAWANVLSSAVLVISLLSFAWYTGIQNLGTNLRLLGLSVAALLLLPEILEMVRPRGWENHLLEILKIVSVRAGIDVAIFGCCVWGLYRSGLWAGMEAFWARRAT